MLVVYRFQTFSNIRESARNRAEKHLEGFIGIDAVGLLPDNMVEKWNRISKEEKLKWKENRPDKVRIIDTEVTRIDRYLSWGTRTRKCFQIFLAVHLAIILGSIVGILIISKVAPFGYIIFWLVIGALLISTISIALVIWSLYFYP